MTDYPRAAEFDGELLNRVHSAVKAGDEISTLSNKWPNRIVAIDRFGVSVETLRSESRRSGPQLVPAWMVVAAWKRLKQKGALSQGELLNELNVKRSGFVMALLAQFPDVVVRSTRPTVLEFVPAAD